MNRWMKCLGALLLVAGIAGVADAGLFKHRGCDTAPSCDVGPAMTYVTEYRDVKRTVYKCVPTTTEKTINETVVTPVKTMEKQEFVTYEQKTRIEKRERTILQSKLETEKREVTVYRPFTETINQEYYECVVTPRLEKRPVTTYVSETHMEERTRTITTVKQVPEVVNRTVTCYQRVTVPNPCYDPCNPCSRPCVCQTVPMTQTIQTTVMRCIPETQLVKFQVPVCTAKPVTSTVEVTVYDRQMVKKTRPVAVTTMKPVKETIEVQVCKTFPVVQKFEVPVCFTEAIKTIKDVEVISWKQEVKPRKVMVTTWSTVTEVITEKVPVTICVPVAPCAPVVPCVK
jgi:hypothetical protein